MNIINKSMITDTIFNLEDGDIFLLDDHYLIASNIEWENHMRVCYDLTSNVMKKIYENKEVVAWDRNTCELIIR